MRAQEIRKEALSKLEGNWIPMIGVCLLTVIAVAALNWLSVLLIPLLIPGLCAFMLKLIRGAKPEITDLVSTYKNYLNALVAYVLLAVIIAVWTFLIVVPCVFFLHLLFAEIFLEIFISPVLTAYALLMTVCSLLLVIPGSEKKRGNDERIQMEAFLPSSEFHRLVSARNRDIRNRVHLGGSVHQNRKHNFLRKSENALRKKRRRGESA